MHPFTKTAIEVYSKNANPEIAPAMSAYMKQNFPYLGIKSPDRPALIQEIVAKVGYPNLEEIGLVCKELWNLQEREYHYIGCELMIRNSKKLPKEFIENYEYFILNKSWWDSIDYFVPKAVSAHFKRFPELIHPYTQKWVKSGNIWLQRSSLLFQLKHKKETDLELLYSIINSLSDSKEFFVQKAIGWILREYSKVNPNEVSRFVSESSNLKPLSRREAMKVIKKWEAGSGKWEVGSGKLEVGSGKWEVGSGKLEVVTSTPLSNRIPED